MTRIAVAGASGFVGATLVESLLESGRDVHPLIHSSGNAWRLARRGLRLTTVDALEPRSLAEALRGCTHVVNCMRGEDSVMLDGLRNLLAAARETGVQRFVHLSSVAVYGDPPPAAAADEDGPTQPQPGSYGWIKLRQDEMVQKAHAAGLPAVILCPPNITGPSSDYLLQLVGAIQSGAFALLDDGSAPCNVVDVRNLAGAIVAALDGSRADGRRYFVTDGAPVSWARLVGTLAREARIDVPLRSLGIAELALAPDAPIPKPSLLRAMKHLVSSDVRAALKRDPLWARLDRFALSMVRRWGGGMADSLRRSVEGPLAVPKPPATRTLNVRLCRQQLRDVVHSSARARADLGYRPQHDFDSSMRDFGTWLRAARGMDTPAWPLLQELY
jgi:nucleoside-diphosphate-sugar epimerase